jgi:hypothetical protein
MSIFRRVENFVGRARNAACPERRPVGRSGGSWNKRAGFMGSGETDDRLEGYNGGQRIKIKGAANDWLDLL